MSKKIVIAIPHSHTWFWLQTCIASLLRYLPRAEGCSVETVVVDNSPWSPAIRGLTDTALGKKAAQELGLIVLPNYMSNKFHASALDCVVEQFHFDYLMTLETDVIALRPTWLQWFVSQLSDSDFAVGHWHHERFLNPSCTLYRGTALREMLEWCRASKEPTDLRWGEHFDRSQPVADRQPERDYRDWYDNQIAWIAGPFADKRGWPAGTELREPPSGQLKGPGWYEPGQMLYHWSIDKGFTCTVCNTLTTHGPDNIPLQTIYGPSISDPGRQLETDELVGNGEAAHLWGGTRALDIIKHEVTCQFVKGNTPMWLAREARFWRKMVPPDVQEQTLALIRQYGWHYKGQGTPDVTDRDRAAANYVRECYEAGGVTW